MEAGARRSAASRSSSAVSISDSSSPDRLTWRFSAEQRSPLPYSRESRLRKLPRVDGEGEDSVCLVTSQVRGELGALVRHSAALVLFNGSPASLGWRIKLSPCGTADAANSPANKELTGKFERLQKLRERRVGIRGLSLFHLFKPNKSNLIQIS